MSTILEKIITPFLIAAMILTASIVGKSQQTYTHGEMLGYNIGFGALNGAIGSMINKPKEEKLGKAFWKGFYKGAIGGCVVYGSKQMVYQFTQKDNNNMLWSARLVNSVGTSMVQNASSHYGMLDYIYFDFAFNRLTFDTKQNFKVSYRIMPFTLITFGVNFRDGIFDFKRTLQSLTTTFDAKSNYSGPNYARSNSIVLRDEEAFGHEVIHTFQHYDFKVVNTFFDKHRKKRVTKSNTIRKLNKIFYNDFPGLTINRRLYGLEGDRGINRNYYDNFFEYEANYFSGRW